MDPTKVEGVRNWATPSTKKHVRSFLGFCNFYRAFIRGFAKLAKPLNNLTKKDAPWVWGNDEQNTFDTLKHRITEEPILRQPQMDKQFELEVDASGYAIGAVLMQRQEDGKRHPVGFYSATLNDAERNYDIYDLELLAVVKSLENWRTYLAGSPHKVVVFTDHMNLQYWQDPHKISRRVARQVLRLAEYDIELRHIPGKTNGRADALSRLPNYNQGGDDNEDVTVLPDHLFVRLSLTEDEERQNEETLRPWVDPHNLREVDGVWWKEGRRVVTGDLAYRRQVVHDHHDLPAYGHPGISRTTALTEHHYWWPRMRQEIRDYVADAQTASETRSTRRQEKPRSHPSSQSQRQCRSRRSRWTSSLSYHFQTGSIPYSRSPTMTAPRQPSSSHATRPLRPKEWPSSTSNTCSSGSGSHRRSSVTATHDWPGSLPGRCVPR
jgi:hypothetical protein